MSCQVNEETKIRKICIAAPSSADNEDDDENVGSKPQKRPDKKNNELHTPAPARAGDGT